MIVPNGNRNAVESDPKRPKFIVSAAGQAAHPDDIAVSSQALLKHLDDAQKDAEAAIKKWEAGIREHELAEKRRLAPGWLDREEKILEPERKQSPALGAQADKETTTTVIAQGHARQDLDDDEGKEIDKAFGIV